MVDRDHDSVYIDLDIYSSDSMQFDFKECELVFRVIRILK